MGGLRQALIRLLGGGCIAIRNQAGMEVKQLFSERSFSDTAFCK